MATKTEEVAENGKISEDEIMVWMQAHPNEAQQLKQQMEQQERQARVDAFNQEYKALCQKYGLEIVAGLALKDLVRQ